MEIQWEHTEIRPGVWEVAFLNAEGSYELSGPTIQGVGVVQGFDIYFGASYDAWSFEANDDSHSPARLSPSAALPPIYPFPMGGVVIDE